MGHVNKTVCNITSFHNPLGIELIIVGFFFFKNIYHMMNESLYGWTYTTQFVSICEIIPRKIFRFIFTSRKFVNWCYNIIRKFFDLAHPQLNPSYVFLKASIWTRSSFLIPKPNLFLFKFSITFILSVSNNAYKISRLIQGNLFIKNILTKKTVRLHICYPIWLP